MPTWAGKWEGGRYYLDDVGRPIYFIEKMRGGVDYSLKLPTYEENEAGGMLALFYRDPARFAKSLQPIKEERPSEVFITVDRLNLYMQSIRKCSDDHRNARRSYLLSWSEKQINFALEPNELKKVIRGKLAEFDGGHKGRVEALNAFANWLVEEGDLPHWKRFVNPFDPKQTRAPRVIYSLEDLRKTYERLGEGLIRDVFYLRAATGMHQTEIDQLEKIPIVTSLLPDKGTGLRILEDEKHQIRAVVQVLHKSRHRHRVSLDAHGLECAQRLRKGVPNRVTMWGALDPIIPSNLRHTFVTQLGEVGRLVTWKDGGLPRAIVAQLVGHREGSTMTADRYENLQVPPMGWIPILD
jgi:integrase